MHATAYMADLPSLIDSEFEARPEVSEVSEDFNDFNLLSDVATKAIPCESMRSSGTEMV